MTETEIAKQNLEAKKTALESKFAEYNRVKSEDLARNKSLLTATNEEAEEARKTRFALIKGGASAFGKAVKIQRDKEIEVSAIAEDIQLAIYASEISIGEMQLELSNLKKEFEYARKAYLDRLAEQLINDFLESPDTRLILAAHIEATKDISSFCVAANSLDAMVNYWQNNKASFNYEELVATKLVNSFRAGGKLKKYTDRKVLNELLADQLDAISTVADVQEMTPGKRNIFISELEAKKAEFPNW